MPQTNALPTELCRLGRMVKFEEQGNFHKTNTLQTRFIYLERRKMILLLFSILSAILALIVRPAIQSLSWIISLNPYSFSKSNLLLLFLLFFMKTSDTHFASLWLKKMLQITIISFSRKTDQDHKLFFQCSNYQGITFDTYSLICMRPVCSPL